MGTQVSLKAMGAKVARADNDPAKKAGALWPLLMLFVALPSAAQYKVVDANGNVTYTDRPPVTSQSKVTPMTSRGSPAGVVIGDSALPLELRQVAGRYPVTLYVVSGVCGPCDTARQLLRQRGVPYAEKFVQTAEDSEALERLSGGRDAPTLSIGSQTLRGLAPEVWGSYLDAAGYPRESRLPAGYQFAAATPLTERREANAANASNAARGASAPDVGVSTPVPAANPSNIRF